MARFQMLAFSVGVGVPAVLHAVGEHDIGLVLDLEDDAVVAAAGRPQPGELADEWFADAVGVVSERAKHQRDSCAADLRWELVEMSDRRRRSLP